MTEYAMQAEGGPPSQEKMLALFVAFVYAAERTSHGIAAAQAALANVLGAPAVVWRDKAWRTVFDFVLVLLQERGVARYSRTSIYLDAAFFADVEPYCTPDAGGAARYARELLDWRTTRRSWEKRLRQRTPTLLDQVGDG
jgi:hypothetical protein